MEQRWCQLRGEHPESATSLSLLPRFGMNRLVTIPVFAVQDEDVWEDGASSHQRLGEAPVQVGDIAFQGEGLLYPVGIWDMMPIEQRIPFSSLGSDMP